MLSRLTDLWWWLPASNSTPSRPVNAWRWPGSLLRDSCPLNFCSCRCLGASTAIVRTRQLRDTFRMEILLNPDPARRYEVWSVHCSAALPGVVLWGCISRCGQANSFMSFEIEPLEDERKTITETLRLSRQGSCHSEPVEHLQEAGYSANPQPPHTVRVR